MFVLQKTPLVPANSGANASDNGDSTGYLGHKGAILAGYVKELKILAESDIAGVYAISTGQGRQLFITGHSEYDPDTFDLLFTNLSARSERSNMESLQLSRLYSLSAYFPGFPLPRTLFPGGGQDILYMQVLQSL